jgi:16S rRNA (adenine1518-N6/adenine1519-N6)-dimethyltransferase
MYPKPKKSLGQNFLVNPRVRERIIEACCLGPSDRVIEIGPGRGSLTDLLTPRVKEIFAVELDPALAGMLRDKYSRQGHVHIDCADFLKWDVLDNCLYPPYKVIGNIPYYISSPILEYLFSYKGIFSEIYLTVQKEYGQRIVARGGSKQFGALSCFVQYHAEPKLLFNISHNSFLPAPKIDSCFLQLSVRRQPLLTKRREREFFRITRSVFNQRRKMLRNCLSSVVAGPRLFSILDAAGIAPTARPEELSLQDFLVLAKLLSG